MPLDNKPSVAVNVNLSKLLERLCASGIEFILVGGLAAVVQGSPVTTMDVDIVHKRTPENIARLMDLLKSLETIYRHPDDKRIEPGESELGGMGQMLFTTYLGPLDILSLYSFFSCNLFLKSSYT